jgi:nitrite reductase (NO-forming)
MPARVHLTVRDRLVQIAPGVRYRSWGFDGTAPGPVIHVRQGQTVQVRLTNGGSMPHSIDFHAARIAPDRAFADVMPGASATFSFVAADPGVFLYHCGTSPALAHIANGMFGAIVVDPVTPLPPVDRSYVLVASDWYLDRSGVEGPAGLSMAKAAAVRPDWVTWNGYAGQYLTHPLTARPGETVRFCVVDAGPSLATAFHVVGALLDRAWLNGDVSSLARGIQTASVPPGGSGIFDVRIERPGLYPFVSHAFASAQLGQAGVLRVGDVHGAMRH